MSTVAQSILETPWTPAFERGQVREIAIQLDAIQRRINGRLSERVAAGGVETVQDREAVRDLMVTRTLVRQAAHTLVVAFGASL